MKNLFFFISIFFFTMQLLSSQPTFYGEKVILAGEIEKKNIQDEVVWILVLDQAIDSLAMPQIGQDKRTQKNISEVILYVPSKEHELYDLFTQGKRHITIEGSIWYADWWIENIPFLVIVNEIYEL